MQEKTDTDPEVKPTTRKKKRIFSKRLKIALTIVIALLIIPLLYALYIYVSSPEAIRNPKMDHYHFRMQILVNGIAENFGDNKYQQDYIKNQCNANLPEQPIHFHDDKDQFVHIHWTGMTGGLVMKNYGWNYIGGIGGSLGYKLDNLMDIQNVTIHGNVLPAVPSGSNFYVYSGDENSYKERNFNDWKNQDLEQFFDKASNFPEPETSMLDFLFPKAYAHGTANDEDGDDGAATEEELTRINNLLGNVVIFVQKDKPTDQNIKDRFNALVPLSDSTCGG